MSQGKYSPCMPNPNGKDFGFNCFGLTCQPWSNDSTENGIKFDPQTMIGGYDCDGFDSYGYSAFNEDGTYAGLGDGVDRQGIDEMEYMQMSADEYNAC